MTGSETVMGETTSSKFAHRFIFDYKNCGVKVTNVPPYISDKDLKDELNRLFDDTILTLDLILDSTDSATGIAFIKFDSIGSKQNCLNLQNEEKYCFVHDHIWEGPLIFTEFTNLKEELENDRNFCIPKPLK
ncbi:unnamed protein product [Rotaria sp. Silwood2]|nr:unnamed protein product [Rotaria sp. Silwood2]